MRSILKNFFVSYWKTLLFFTLVGLVGGFFTGIYLMDSYSEEIRQQLLEAGMNNLLLGAVSSAQSAAYGLILGAIGIFLGKKTGLWKDERTLTKKPLISAAVCGTIGGMVMILSDVLFFGRYCEVILESYASKPTVPYLVAMILYGGVIEEVMLRLFIMTLIAFLLHKLFWRKNEKTPVAALVVANIIAAILFSVGHLPATFALIGNSPMILLRCFLLNGGLGLAFGRLYRRCGLRYAMIAHGLCHVVSKLIWILFL